MPTTGPQVQETLSKRNAGVKRCKASQAHAPSRLDSSIAGSRDHFGSKMECMFCWQILPAEHTYACLKCLHQRIFPFITESGCARLEICVEIATCHPKMITAHELQTAHAWGQKWLVYRYFGPNFINPKPKTQLYITLDPKP